MVRKRAKVAGKGTEVFFGTPGFKRKRSTSTQPKKRHTTYFLLEDLKYIKRLGFDRDKKFYQVLAEMIAEYRKRNPVDM